jgi:hypothetical protein
MIILAKMIASWAVATYGVTLLLGIVLLNNPLLRAGVRAQPVPSPQPHDPANHGWVSLGGASGA